VGLGLLYAFETVNLSGVGLLAPIPTPKLEGPCPLNCVVWMALPGAHSPARIALRVIGARKPPFHDKAIVLKEGQGHIICKIAKNVRILGRVWTYTPLESIFTNYDSVLNIFLLMEGEM
jgi:hypothetical protein